MKKKKKIKRLNLNLIYKYLMKLNIYIILKYILKKTF